MMHQVIITTESPETVKPLLHAAIRDQLKVLELGIQRTRERLTTFEKQYGMTTQEFARRFEGQELKETLFPQSGQFSPSQTRER